MRAFRAALTRIVVATVLAMLCAGNPLAQDSDLARANALDQQVIQLYRQGLYGDAVPVATDVLAIREKALGPDHPDVARGLNSLALLYHHQGRYTEAEPLYQRNLPIAEKARGPEQISLAARSDRLSQDRHRGQGAGASGQRVARRARPCSQCRFRAVPGQRRLRA
jgi:tetratricopeptide (TPR) repeat protein